MSDRTYVTWHVRHDCDDPILDLLNDAAFIEEDYEESIEGRKVRTLCCSDVDEGGVEEMQMLKAAGIPFMMFQRGGDDYTPTSAVFLGSGEIYEVATDIHRVPVTCVYVDKDGGVRFPDLPIILEYEKKVSAFMLLLDLEQVEGYDHGLHKD